VTAPRISVNADLDIGHFNARIMPPGLPIVADREDETILEVMPSVQFHPACPSAFRRSSRRRLDGGG